MNERLPEEGMMFHTALPEMLASLPRRSLEPVRAFLVLEKIREIKKSSKGRHYSPIHQAVFYAALVAQLRGQ